MSKSSKQIAINFPYVLLGVFESHLPRKHFRDFVREALAEKMERDFGEKIPKEHVNRRLGERVDLRNPSPEKTAQMRRQAKQARLARRKPSQ